MLKVLILVARPLNFPMLGLKEEVQKIVYRIAKTPHGSRIKIVDEWATRFTDVPPLLLEHQPDIVHFSGHGSDLSELLFEDDLGVAVPVSKAAMISLFQSETARSIRCLLLNACYTGELAKELSQLVDFVIGTQTAITESAAIAFAETFYPALLYGKSVMEAYKLATSQFQAHADPLQPGPALFTRAGIDPDTALISATAEPANSAASPSAPSKNEDTKKLEAIVAAYRLAFQDRYRIWQRDPLLPSHHDLGRQPAVPFEDAFHQPQLRTADGSRTADMTDLLSSLGSGIRMLVQAPGGMGKTTWLKALFRELLAQGRHLPVMLELRTLAALFRDQEKNEEERSLDAAIHAVGARFTIAGFREGWPQLLKAPGALPGMILLLDGWDEAGPIGSEIREKLLAFLARYPWAGVIVTSRYYGDGLPTIQDGFATWSLLPLSNDDIAKFARRYFHAFRPPDQDSDGALKQFCEALQRSASGVRELAHTPLLLTMMLENFAEIPFPNKRHILYEECIRLLLTARPDKKTADGALLAERCFRPDDAHERMSAVAALSAEMLQSDSFGWHTREELERSLPQDWPADVPSTERTQKRRGFLAWLEGPAGLLVQDESGRRLRFINQCLQEYLAAWHHNETIEGDSQRTAAFLNWSGKARYREMLLLWASLMHGTDLARKVKRLPPILAALQSAENTQRQLAGAILASGAGDEAAFARWLEEFPKSASNFNPFHLVRLKLQALLGRDFSSDRRTFATTAWANSEQSERKQRMAKRLSAISRNANALDWIEIARLARRCGLQLEESAQPVTGVVQTLRSEFLAPSFSERRQIAIGKLLGDLDPGSLRGEHGLAMIPLLLWPSQRRIAGQVLQCAAALGARRSELRVLAAKLLRGRPTSKASLERQQLWWTTMLGGVRAIDTKITDASSREALEAVSKDFVLSFDDFYALQLGELEDKTEDGTIAQAAERLSFKLGHLLGRAAAKAKPSSLLRHPLVQDLIVPLALPLLFGSLSGLPPTTTWLLSYAKASVMIFGRAATGELVLQLQGSPLEFFIPAYRASLLPSTAQSQAALQQVLSAAAASCDPFYVALAKHLARISTPEDQALLHDVIAGAASRPEPLRSIIDAVLRGDIETDEGRITLDELAAECKLPPLPNLDAPAPEVMVDPAELEKQISMSRFTDAVQKNEWSELGRVVLGYFKRDA